MGAVESVSMAPFRLMLQQRPFTVTNVSVIIGKPALSIDVMIYGICIKERHCIRRSPKAA